MIEMLTLGKRVQDLEMKYKGILAQEFETKGLEVDNRQPFIVTSPHKVLLEIHSEMAED